MDKAFSTIAGTALGAYIIAVVMNGNGPKLVSKAKKDWRYIEFLAAVYALYLLHKSSFGGQVADMLITTAIIAVLIKIAAESDTNFRAAFTDFATHKDSNGDYYGLTELFQTLIGNAKFRSGDVDKSNPSVQV